MTKVDKKGVARTILVFVLGGLVIVERLSAAEYAYQFQESRFVIVGALTNVAIVAVTAGLLLFKWARGPRLPATVGNGVERIIAAADRYKGVVFTGPDHGTIGLRGPTFDVGFPERKNLNFVGEQGFITSRYRFVYRKDAAAIAIASGQIKMTHYLPDGELDSRDVKGTPGYTGAKSIFRETEGQ